MNSNSDNRKSFWLLCILDQAGYEHGIRGCINVPTGTRNPRHARSTPKPVKSKHLPVWCASSRDITKK
ncbi:hypothetical protein DASB73_040760 [Starmerella bacillaris]|uniref:Uncharacterized protein n=1 Tax=Starmerella bacillaris TaxID=1247836 RepID=A0AAV5RQZ5_STABA|nr:hypothetical protein DASB73_040760 [Starmerella bacillaris]